MLPLLKCHNWGGSIFEALKKIKTVDIFIIIILIILLANTAATVFIVSDTERQIATKLDLGFRTTLSSLVGYILSSNFINNKVEEKMECTIIVDEAEKKQEKNIQLIIVGLVAISTLIILLIVRYFFVDLSINGSNALVIYDICIGSIGFLIGYTD